LNVFGNAIEHFQKYCSHSVLERTKSGLFGFWLRFGSVTGFFKPAPSPKPRQNPKILAPNGYSISSNALLSKSPFRDSPENETPALEPSLGLLFACRKPPANIFVAKTQRSDHYLPEAIKLSWQTTLTEFALA